MAGQNKGIDFFDFFLWKLFYWQLRVTLILDIGQDVADRRVTEIRAINDGILLKRKKVSGDFVSLTL
jgi:hypothetical protein